MLCEGADLPEEVRRAASVGQVLATGYVWLCLFALPVGGIVSLRPTDSDWGLVHNARPISITCK